VPGSLVGDPSSTTEVPVAHISAFKASHGGGSRFVVRAEHLVSRLRVRLFHWGLDSRLAGGVDPASHKDLEVRSAQLVSARHRRRLAEAVERVVREADARPAPSFSVVLGVARDQIADARSSLLFLAYLLRVVDQPGARGVAIAERLLTDGGSEL
jgi:hypothetical protein